MNAPDHPVDRLLMEELNRLLDRIAARALPGVVALTEREHPALRAELEEADARLSAQRLAVLDAYEGWRAAMERVENLWVLSTLRAA